MGQSFLDSCNAWDKFFLTNIKIFFKIFGKYKNFIIKRLYIKVA